MAPIDIVSVPAVEGGLMLAVTAMMAEAFRHDPLQAWLFPNSQLRVRRLRRVYELDVLHRLTGHSRVYLGNHHGVAFWHPPDEWALPFRSALRVAPAYSSVLAHHPLRARRILLEVLRRHPPEPHWYLSHLAVAASHRQHGLGRHLLEIGLEHAAQDGVGTYLETANPANLSFYAAAGFGQVGIVRVGSAPPVWMLWRKPP